MPRRRSSAARSPSATPYMIRNEDDVQRTSLPQILVNSPPNSNFQTEVFQYDPDQLPKLAAPIELVGSLPTQLDKTIANWQYAGAAMITALERVHELDKESVHRGWPQARWMQQRSARAASPPIATVAIADTPPSSPADALNKIPPKSCDGITEAAITGIESPPFTPLDVPASPTPIDLYDVGASPNPIIAQQLTTKFSKIRVDSVSFDGPEFHEPSWNNFVNCYRSEMMQLRQNFWPRFRDWTYRVEQSRAECHLGEVTAKTFDDWWADMKTKYGKIHEEISILHAPNLEVIRLERGIMGLSV